MSKPINRESREYKEMRHQKCLRMIEFLEDYALPAALIFVLIVVAVKVITQ